MAKKEWTEQERWELAGKLYQIIGADIDYDEEQAIYDAISIVSPTFSDAIEERLQDSEDYAEALRVAMAMGLEEPLELTEKDKAFIAAMDSIKKELYKRDYKRED